MDFEAVAGELYAVPREDFTRLRNERVAQARADGEPDLAARIQRLRKPTSSAALVNHLARERPADVAELGRLGESLREAHTELAGDRLRALSRQRHELVRNLTRAAAELSGGRVTESVSGEVTSTLDAAVADPEAAREVERGRLESALRPPDPFAAEWLPTKGAAGRPSARTGRPSKRRGEPEPEKPARRDKDRERLKRAREAAAQARTARDSARRRLRAAERDEAKARERTAEARKALDAADREVSRAERIVAELRGG